MLTATHSSYTKQAPEPPVAPQLPFWSQCELLLEHHPVLGHRHSCPTSGFIKRLVIHLDIYLLSLVQLCIWIQLRFGTSHLQKSVQHSLKCPLEYIITSLSFSGKSTWSIWGLYCDSLSACLGPKLTRGIPFSKTAPCACVRSALLLCLHLTHAQTPMATAVPQTHIPTARPIALGRTAPIPAEPLAAAASSAVSFLNTLLKHFVQYDNNLVHHSQISAIDYLTYQKEIPHSLILTKGQTFIRINAHLHYLWALNSGTLGAYLKNS